MELLHILTYGTESHIHQLIFIYLFIYLFIKDETHCIKLTTV